MPGIPFDAIFHIASHDGRSVVICISWWQWIRNPYRQNVLLLNSLALALWGWMLVEVSHRADEETLPVCVNLLRLNPIIKLRLRLEL